MRLLLVTVAAACDVSSWVYGSSRWAPPGYHVLCITGSQLELWRGGHWEDRRTWTEKSTVRSTVRLMRKELEKRLDMKKNNVLPWLLADTDGATVQRAEQLEGLLLIFEGGRWVWPGIREGFTRRLALQDSKRLKSMRKKRDV